MKTLNIFEGKEEVVETISFEEIMNYDGSWCESKTLRAVSEVVELDCGSGDYHYYLQQKTNGRHILYRNKK